MKKILVGFDGSEYSKKALIEATEIAQKFSAEMVVVNVYNEPFGHDLTQKVLEKARVISEDGEVKFELVSVLSSDTAGALVEAAKKDKVDLIVVGSKGMGAIRAHVLGSVASDLSHSSPVSVLIVR
ncbi:MAG: universal stress protein [Candidatus Bathyarchaeia archaeon]